jgi:hypothetical protein
VASDDMAPVLLEKLACFREPWETVKRLMLSAGFDASRPQEMEAEIVRTDDRPSGIGL